MRNILVPKLFDFAKKIVVHLLHLRPAPSSVQLYCLLTERQQDLMTSLFSLMTLNYLKTSYMILTKLGAFYLVTSGMF